MRLLAGLIIVLAVVAAILVPQVLFVVDETQLGIVTRFGEAVRDNDKPGLYFKTPFIEQVIYLDKRLLLFDAPPDSLVTKDKKRLIIDVYARGLIIDAKKFVTEVATQGRGASRTVEIVSSELRREIGLDDQSEIIETSRESIMDKVRDAVQPKLDEFGIEVVDVRIKRADFPSEIASSVHERMKAERKRKADKERAEGKRTDAEVRANVDKLATIIRSAAQRDADILRGCGEAEAIRIFAEALEQDPEFYTFVRSLEAYSKYLSQNATVVGSAAGLGQTFEDIRQAVIKAAATPEGATDPQGQGAAANAPQSRCEQLEAESAARRLLAGELAASGAALVLDLGLTKKEEWGSSSLGCPVEGQAYAQVVTSGWSFSFDHLGATYEVHATKDGNQAVTCE